MIEGVTDMENYIQFSTGKIVYLFPKKMCNYLDELRHKPALLKAKKVELYKEDELYMKGTGLEISNEICHVIYDGSVIETKYEDDILKIKAKWFD